MADSFAADAVAIAGLKIRHRVHATGGYGSNGEVIHEAPPFGCPSVVAFEAGDGVATLQSNGSMSFDALPRGEGSRVRVLGPSFDAVEKRESGVPTQNMWLRLETASGPAAASLINPRPWSLGVKPRCTVVKVRDPERAMWFVQRWDSPRLRSALRIRLVETATGPALLRDLWIENAGRLTVRGSVWSYFLLAGTQRFVYNKSTWYDQGLLVSPTETVVAATVPYDDVIQIKRVSTSLVNLRAAGGTCDYAEFVGDSSASALAPMAVSAGHLLERGTARKMNRFSSPTVAVGRYDFELGRGDSAIVRQALLYINDPAKMARFRDDAACDEPVYDAIAAKFRSAARSLLLSTPSVRDIAGSVPRRKAKAGERFFSVGIPDAPVIEAYANSLWTTVDELYEHCRGHGALLADGIELGTRDRAQDMWPKMKSDPGRVRRDLIHALGFVIRVGRSRGPRAKRLSRLEKMDGMLPRQYPSAWVNRKSVIYPDMRPYADSGLWLIDALVRYIRETGDAGVLKEKTSWITLSKPATPAESGITGGSGAWTVLDAVSAIVECFGRHVADSPYGMAQIMFGDWCDPVDMFGTSVIGDPSTRGEGRGTSVRLSAHLFCTLVDWIDLLTSLRLPHLRSDRLRAMQKLASRLRLAVCRWAWEDNGKREFSAGFLSAIHELRLDGSRPEYKRGERGYSLGSMLGGDYDGRRRRELVAQSHGLLMLATKRQYLEPIPGADGMIQRLLSGVDRCLYSPKVGLRMYSIPLPNNAATCRFVGRMGVLPSGCAENGEYHHAQVMLHAFRLGIAGEQDRVWRQFSDIVSSCRDESLCGPFETPCTSYASDSTDPHFGRGFYFGLTGSIDWLVEVFERVAGVSLSLQATNGPRIRIEPVLPGALGREYRYSRIVHVTSGPGIYRKIPLEIMVRRGDVLERTVRVNGRGIPDGTIDDPVKLKRIKVEVILPAQVEQLRLASARTGGGKGTGGGRA